MIINKKEVISKKAGISYFEIFLLVLSTVAFSYILSSGLEIVKAENSNCCLEDKNGAICQDVSADYTNCKTSLIPAKCQDVSSCKLGCCFDYSEGLCTPNSPKQKCEQNNGTWKDNAACNIADCQLGCCVLGDNTAFVTEKRCEKLSAFYGNSFNFDSTENQIGCLIAGKNQKQGACLIGDNGCKFGTEADCLRMNGNFNENILCTNPELNTTCQKTKNTGCIEGKEEVYFKDSCGNIANIYDSGKVDNQDYWENVTSKENTCNSNSANINNPGCGNCNYLLGSKCSLENGKAVCKDLNCKNAPWVIENDGKILKTKDRKQGEAWCVYDNKVGVNKIGNISIVGDVPGSRHWRYYCLDGEVKVEGCSDLRQEVCGKIEIENQEINESDVVEKAESIGCVSNRWRECVGVTSEIYFGKTNDFKAQEDLFKNLEKTNFRDDLKKKCEDIGQCEYYELTLKKTPIIPICKPKFPGGLNFWEINNTERNVKESSELTCNVATAIPYIGTCTKITLTGDCSGCISGCDCGTEKWLIEANNICRSFGDCGANVNIAGEISTYGYQSNVGKDTSKLKPGKLLPATYLASLKLLVKDKTEENVIIEYKNISNASALGNLGKIARGGLRVGGIMGSLPIISGLMESTTGKIIASVAYMAYINPWIYPMCPICSFYVFIKVILGSGCGIKKTYYHYTCMPYQSPKGGENCEKINNNDLKASSEYRCKSLGAGCEFLNEGTGNEACVWLYKNDSAPPEITPWKEILKDASYEKETCSSSEGCYKIKGTEAKECIKPYTQYSLGVKVSEYAQCKIDMNHTNSFEEMESWFDDNSYLKQHRTNISFISPGHVYESLGVKIPDKYDFYIRCSDANGNENKDELSINLCVDEGEDKNPARIVRTIPENNAFIPYAKEEIELGLYVNEPAECKYSLQDKNYNSMENAMNCSTSIIDVESDFTYLCSSSLPLTGNSTKFYFKCRDQPWLNAENESRRNTNTESFVYELKKSTSELKITKIEPSGTIKAGVEPVSVTLTAKTEGGAESGKAICSWEIGSWKNNFFNTDSSIHSSILTSMPQGSYTLYVNCKDIAGNEANGETNFNVEVDTKAPKIIRAYNAGTLKIFTNEDAVCVYGFNTCNFILENATAMNGILREHDADWQQGRTYYIKCKDLYENKPSGCSIILTTY